MAIKSKKPRSKPKQVARAPRREPVAVPTPFLSRRWVQAVAVFVVGVFAMTFFVWLTNGLRSNDAEAEAAAEAATKRQAAIAYQTAVEDAFGTIGVINEGIVPAVFPEMLDTLQQMKDGATPKDAATVFQDAATGAKDATDAIVTFDVSGQIADQGFNVPEATLFTSSAQQLSLALLGFQRCAEGGTRVGRGIGRSVRGAREPRARPVRRRAGPALARLERLSSRRRGRRDRADPRQHGVDPGPGTNGLTTQVHEARYGDSWPHRRGRKPHRRTWEGGQTHRQGRRDPSGSAHRSPHARDGLPGRYGSHVPA